MTKKSSAVKKVVKSAVEKQKKPKVKKSASEIKWGKARPATEETRHFPRTANP